MATSSIRKQFILRDRNALKRLEGAAKRAPTKHVTKVEDPLRKGRELLKQFYTR